MTKVQVGGQMVDFDGAGALMDSEIREQLHGQFDIGEEQAFMDAYVKAHAAKYDGEEFQVN
jgi:hypothetical protein